MIDLLLTNADLPLAEDSSADAIAITGGRIIAVGERNQLGRATRVARELDLRGRTVLPGFNDAHVHLWKVGHLMTTLVDLRGARSLDDVRSALVLRASSCDGWVLARGVNELRLAEGRLPSRADLDAWLPGHPVWVTRACNHVGIASSTALRSAGVDRSTAVPTGGEVRRDASGELTGVFTETAMRLVADAVPPPTDNELRAMILAATRRQLSLGITAATDPGVDDRVLGVYRQMDADRELVGRYNVMRLAPDDATSDAMADWDPPSTSDHLRVDTAKLFIDGGLSGATAALSAAYRHADTRGVLRYEANDYGTLCGKADAAGYRVATHVIGDRAIATALDAWKQQPPAAARRARFEHFGLPTPRDVALTASLGIGVATQAIFLPELGANFREYLPDAFPITPYPIRQMLAAGLNLALSTDAPVVTDERPLAGVAAAVNRLDGSGNPIGPDESISVREALLAYTREGAKLSGDAERFGAIRSGLAADLVVLARSPFETSIDELADIEVDKTLVAGRVVYER